MKLKLNYKDMPLLPYIQRKELPAKPGIYYIGSSASPVMYVGLSRNLKSRHINHHRQGQFESIENPMIRYRVVTEDLLATISDLTGSLKKLEKQAINEYKPVLNNTPVPNQPKIITEHGPTYIQIHKVREAGYCSHFDAQDGDELTINTSRLPLLTKAIEEQRPIFLIASGSYQDYAMTGYPHLSELFPYKQERIYLLISCFIPYGYEDSNCFGYDYVVYGGTSKIFINPYNILNKIPGFEEFKRSYLKLGFTNCECSSFTKDLLRLGNINLLSPHKFS
ncbi:GIY-YIG nuclease family protein [Chlorogloeopsis sp. ULAP01]|uniref:GIY-YIG nuclease family protein n=1 Tax=Chlorogloeopsis sp. ULAP01 TaxID=3056483 RepID=UPI0025AABED5|nr:GIY-YIG nuclease family protein [Chlorogloeopsis sp. ULAP01]MDM9379146.1 GIY-YIG nuclease family protein [Chlorogloeopsis sp. ULAP01]